MNMANPRILRRQFTLNLALGTWGSQFFFQARRVGKTWRSGLLERPSGREPLAFLMIWADAGARLEGFAFSADGGAPAFACWSRSRTITRIHSGSADRPLRKSS